MWRKISKLSHEGKWPRSLKTQPTKQCRLSSILPAAAQRLSLCKTDIYPEAFSFFSLFFNASLVLYFLVCTMCHMSIYGLSQNIKTSAFIIQQGQEETNVKSHMQRFLHPTIIYLAFAFFATKLDIFGKNKCLTVYQIIFVLQLVSKIN